MGSNGTNFKVNFLKNCSITFFLFLHEASLGWHKQHIISRIWLNHSKGCFLEVKGQNFDIFGLLDHFLKNWQVFFFYFWMNLPKDGTKPLDKDEFDWITLNVIFQGQKDKKIVPLLSFWHIRSVYSKAVW